MKRRVFLIGHRNRRVTVLRVLPRSVRTLPQSDRRLARGPWTVHAVVVPSDKDGSSGQEAA